MTDNLQTDIAGGASPSQDAAEGQTEDQTRQISSMSGSAAQQPMRSRPQTAPLDSQVHRPGDMVRTYQVVQVIGQGKFGAVYQARDIRNPTIAIALKETLQPDNNELFQREFKALHQMRHPNLPRYHDLFSEGERSYLVMDYVPGQNLLDVLRKRGKLADGRREPLPESLVLGSYTVQICEALLYLHSQKLPILHRDIKPANIRVTPEGLIKLVDFGLLKYAGDQTYTDIRGIGTAPYAPLEQYSSSTTPTDQRSDIYSLAALIYHLLTGQVPVAAIQRLGKAPDPLPPIHQFVPNISPHVSDAIMIGMNLAKQDRYADITIFKQALLNPAMVDLPRTLRGHSASVLGVTYSPDGNILASSSADGTIRLWQASGKRTTSVLKGHVGGVNGVTYSPYGHLIATAGEDLSVRLWSTSDGTAKGALHGHMGNVCGVSWNPNGQFIASCGLDSVVQIWRTSSGNLVGTLRGHQNAVNHVSWSPNGKYVASAGADGTVRLWQVSNGLVLFVMQGHADEVLATGWSPDGKLVASAGSDHTVRLWRVRDGGLVLILRGHTDRVNDLIFTPDGQTIISVSHDQTLRFWRTQDGHAVRIMAIQAGSLNSVACNPQGKTFTIGCGDGTVREYPL